jgi:hypothetical protein
LALVAVVLAGCASSSGVMHRHPVSTTIPGASVDEVRDILTGVIQGQQRLVLSEKGNRVTASAKRAGVPTTDCGRTPRLQVYTLDEVPQGVKLSAEYYACDRGKGDGEHRSEALQYTSQRLTRELESIRKMWIAKYDPSLKLIENPATPEEARALGAFVPVQPSASSNRLIPKRAGND